MDIARLIYFCEIVRLKSFTLAARKLRLTQPALSKSIRSLEDELGTSLIIRNRQGVQPTAKGKILLAEAEDLIQKAQGIKALLKFSDIGLSGKLSLGMSDNLSNYVLPKVWTSFLAKYPNVELKIYSGTSEAIQEELLAKRVEVGLSFHEGTHARLKSEHVADVEFVIVSAAALRVKDLNQSCFVGSISEDYRAPYAAVKILRNLGVRPAKTIQANQQEVQKSLALAGLGFTIVPKFMVERNIHVGELKVIPTPARSTVPLFISDLIGIKGSMLVAAFKDHLVNAIPSIF